MEEMPSSASLLHVYVHALDCVQIDELGRATSSLDGVGICWSSGEDLLRRPGCYTLLVTHFLELCQLSALYPSVRNLHLAVSTSSASLRYLFKVGDGRMSPSTEQYGIQLAQMAAFPASLIDEARATQQRLKAFVDQQHARGPQHRHSQLSAQVPSNIVPPTPMPTEAATPSNATRMEVGRRRRRARITRDAQRKTHRSAPFTLTHS
jgi:DNA mismatch repair ATPase MutS